MWIRRVRESVGFPVAVFANELGVTRATLSAWESGAGYTPSPELLNRMTTRFEVPARMEAEITALRARTIGEDSDEATADRAVKQYDEEYMEFIGPEPAVGASLNRSISDDELLRKWRDNGRVHLRASIFMSYRRSDTGAIASRLHDRLTTHYGSGDVFFDVVSIRPASDFIDKISIAISGCNVFLAIIGKDWLGRLDCSRLRISDPADLVRVETEQGLLGSIPVLPVLINGAHMPTENELPETVAKLARMNAVDVAEVSFEQDYQNLVDVIDHLSMGHES